MNDFIVSICVVAYNEENYLPKLFDDILSQTYPKEKTEIVLVDSASTDGTKAVLESFKRDYENSYHSIVIADNPKKLLAAGCNTAIRASSGDIIVRIDAHAQIPPEFVENNVRHHENGEFVTGGARPNIIDGDTPYKRTLLMAESSMFGSSIADYRRNTEKSYVKSIFHGAYRREVYEKSGLYNEALGRTEDNEMSLRIRDNGYKICMCPDIISYQQTRSSLKKMLKQKYGNGYWVARTLKICPRCISIYHLVPFVFLLGIICAIGLSFVSWIFPAIYFGLYALVAVLMTVFAIVAEKKRHIVNLILPILFFLLHFSYGFGSLVGFLSLIKKPPTEDEKKVTYM